MLISKKSTQKKTTNKRSSNTAILPQLPNFGTLFLGILIGIFIASLIVFMFSTSDITLKIPLGRNKKVKEQAININITKENKEAQTIEPRFDFYTELAKNNTEPAADLKPKVSPINEYLIQVGSHKKKSDADALRAELTLNGYIAKIIADKQGEEIRHNVVLGPYKDKEKAQKIQQELKLLAINSNLISKNLE